MTLMICLLIWVAMIYVRLRFTYGRCVAGSPDSAAYIECARSIYQGKGLLITQVYGGLHPELFQPINLWPPGYPILIALFARTGLHVWNAAIAVSALSGAAFIVMVCYVCRSRFTFPLSLLVSLGIVSMPIFTFISSQSLSDASYLAAAAASMLALITAQRSPRHARWLFLAGIAAGSAWCIRNVGVALFAASGLFFVLQLAWRPVLATLKSACIWALGCVLAGGWLVIRNLHIFGRINPYEMLPSERGLYENVLDTLSTILVDFSSLDRMHHRGFAMTALFLLGVASVAVVILWLRKGTVATVCRWMRTQPDLLIYVLYSGFYLIVVISARTVYRWGEFINSRHIVPIHWIIWILGSLGLMRLFRALGWSLRKIELGMVSIMTLGMLMQAHAQLDTNEAVMQQKPELLDLMKVQQLAGQVCEGQIILSDRPLPLCIFGKLNARMLLEKRLAEEPLVLEQVQEAGRAGLLWGMIIQDRDACIQGVYGDFMREVAQKPERAVSFQQVEDDRGLLVLKWIPASSDVATTGP